MDVLLMRNVCAAGRQAVGCFSFSVFLFTVSFFSGSLLGHSQELWLLTLWGPGLYFCLFNFICTLWYKGFTYEVSVRSFFLGATFSTGLYLSTFNNGWRVFGLYAMILSTFHFSEFLSVALTNPRTLTIDSFILNHSLQYWIAAVASWVEWAVEYYYLPEMKNYFWLSYIGAVICIGGEILRKLAMFTAKTNFNHTVQFSKSPDHQLITHGVYSYCRHPSYVGWFYWSVGTQITMLNPVCVVLYALASWRFFHDRIYAEEFTLRTFFGRQYCDYQAKVGTGLPRISGYVPEHHNSPRGSNQKEDEVNSSYLE